MFHLSASDPRVQIMFHLRPAQLAQPRVPIKERALKAAETQAISYGQAREHIDERRFTIGQVDFALSREGELADPATTATLIANLGSIFDQANVNLALKGNGPTTLRVALHAYEKTVSLNDNPLYLGTDAGRLLDLTFLLIKPTNLLELSGLYVKTPARGIGGRTLAALYNTAVTLGEKKIIFSTLANDHAWQFYFHLDFGKPVNVFWNEWELPL
ncbi:MAG: hypothetical protein WC529_06330 [Candidatus Margulisiibacteriota bacterium]